MAASQQTPITLRLASCMERPGAAAIRYCVATRQIASDVPVNFLDAYREEHRAAHSWPAEIVESAPVTHECVARGWLAGREREMRCRYSRTGIGIEIEGVGRFRVARPSAAISCEELAPGVGREVLEETVLGPPLSLALIVHGIWCLHASACASNKGAALILGHSGDGKSTLAGSLERAGGRGLLRTADDIVPCSLADNVAQAHFHYPQLKLVAERQYPRSAPGSVPIDLLVALDRAPANATPRLDELAPAAAAKLLAEQTIAVKLFDRETHRNHLELAAGVIGAARTWRLRYPHAPGKLPDVARLVARLMEGKGRP